MSKKRKPKGLSWAGKAGLYAGKRARGGIEGIQKYRAGAPGRRRMTMARLKETRQIQKEKAQISLMKTQIRRQKLAPFVKAYERFRPRRRAVAPRDDTGTTISIRVRKPRPRVEKVDEGELRRFDMGELSTFEDIAGARKKKRKTKVRRWEI